MIINQINNTNDYIIKIIKEGYNKKDINLE